MNGHDSIRTLDLAIANGGTASAGVELLGHAPIAVITPAALTSTSAEIQASVDGGTTWLPVHDRTGTKYTLTLSTSRWTAISPADIAGLPMVRIVVASAEAAARTLQLVCRALG